MIREVLLVEASEFDLKVKDKEELFCKMSEIFYENGAINNQDEFKKALYEREKISVTGMSDNVAIPHGKGKCVVKPTVLYCKLNKPIKYECLEGEEIDKVFMLAIPEESSSMHIQMLSSLARKLMHKDFIENLNNCKNTEDLLGIL